jgi:small redox-active disulfide protein 2
MKTVIVYGPGCRRCDALARMVEETASRLGVPVVIENVTDPARIVVAGVLSTPGLAVEGRIVHAGGMPSREPLEKWLAG